MENYSAIQHYYYSNPAFCQQSEFATSQSKSPPRALSPQRSLRQSPVGAQSPGKALEVPATINDGTKLTTSNDRYVCYGDNGVEINAKQLDNDDDFEEQEFYEEMIVDDRGLVQKKKVVVVSNLDAKNGNSDNYKYVRVPDNANNNAMQARQNSPASRNLYAIMAYTDDDITNSNSRHRYEYIPMKVNEIRRSKSFTSPPKKRQYEIEEVPVGNGRTHRYAVIPMEDETELMENEEQRLASPVKKASLDQSSKNRYEYILPPPYQEYQEDSRKVLEPQDKNVAYRQSNVTNQTSSQSIRRVTSPQSGRKVGNPIATQKLHELLSTPRKVRSPSSVVRTPQRTTSSRIPTPIYQETTPSRRINNSGAPPLSPVTNSPFVTAINTTNRSLKKAPKAQQKLNYALSTRQMTKEQRHTAIVTPICSSPVQSVLSDTTYSHRSESWMNLSINKKPVYATLTAAAVMMMLCGGLASGLCFYMVSVMGRLYYLDFGIVSGFACLLLGLLGFRSRNFYYWLPNRNYMSGYIILTLFSLLTCVGLLVLLFMQPRPGTPLADMTSGAICGISVLSLVLASAGVISSYCCKFPPPDNRVEHCAEGFVV